MMTFRYGFSSIVLLVLISLLFSPHSTWAQQSKKLTLEGDLDYATAANSADLRFEGSDDVITMEVWFKHDGTSDADAYIFDKLDSENRGYDLHLVGSGEEVPIQFTLGGNRTLNVTSNTGIPAGRWTHVAVTYDGSAASLYVNGELDAQTSADRDIWKGDATPRIGANDTADDRFFSGEIDELRIWNESRSASEIKENRFSPLAGSETNLIAYYPFDSGAELTDQSGNGHALSLAGDAGTETRDVFPVPPDLYVENEGAGQVQLHWKERTGPNGANAASDVVLYRSPPTGLSGRSQIAQVGASAFPYTASDLSNGKTYFWEAAVVDSEGNESDYSPLITGTPYNGSEPTPMKGGAALALDGDLDYASVGNRHSLSFIGQNDSITVETWIKHDSTSDTDARILDKLDGNKRGYDLHLVGSGEEVPVQFTLGANRTLTVTSNAGIPADRWTHVAVTYDGSTASLYINGTLDATSSADRDIWEGEANLHIGADDAGNDHFFSGRIDEVRIWDVARTKAEIQANDQTELVGNEEGLRGYWRFNDAGKGAMQGASIGFATRKHRAILQDDAAIEGPGALPLPPRAYAQAGDAEATLNWSERAAGEAQQFTVYRATTPDGGSRSALTTQGAATTTFSDTGPSNDTNTFYEVTSTNGQGQESDYAHPAPVTPSTRPFGNALTLDGDDYASVSDRPSLSITNKTLTVEAWVKHDGTSDSNARILDKLDGNSRGYVLRLDGSGQEVPVAFTTGGNRTQTIVSDSSIAANRWTHVAVTYDGSTLSLYLNGTLNAQQSASKELWDGDTPLRIGTGDAANGYFLSGAVDDVRIWDDARSADEILQHYRTELMGNEQGLVGYWRFNETPGTAVSRAAAMRPKTVSLSSDATRTSSTIESSLAFSSMMVSSNGTNDFGATGADVTFSGTSGSGLVSVEKFGSTPTLPNGISESNVSTYRFVFSAGGDLTFDSNTEVRFDVGTLSGVTDPSDVEIYKRSSVYDGTFTALNADYNSSTDELVVTTGSFSEFVLASNTNPLPVELTGFDAAIDGGTVALSWTTASETGNAGFQVQRRISTTSGKAESSVKTSRRDASTWTTVGSVDGAGTTAEAQSYRFTDTDLPYEADSLTYRLKQVDTDGSTSLSKTVTVQRKVEAVRLLGTYPNPARQQATVRYAVPKTQDVHLRLYDALGRQVRTVASEATAGRHKQMLDVSDLSSGVYFLQMRADGSVKTQKLTVVQ